MKCPLCYSKNTRIFHHRLWHGRGKVYRCNKCDVTFLSQVMNAAQENKFYSRYEKHVRQRGVISSVDIRSFHKLSRSIAAERIKRIGDYFKPSDCVLEIGSSSGAFLELLKSQKKLKALYAIEPCLKNRKFCKKFAQCYADITRVPQRIKFNTIVLFHVFEHFRKPKIFLKHCEALLKKNGILIIEVPNIGDPLISLYESNSFKDFYFQPMHPYVYSKKSLSYVFSKSSFRIQKIIYYQKYDLDNHLTWLSKGKPNGDKNLKKIFSELKYKEALENNKKTDTIILVLKKKSPK